MIKLLTFDLDNTLWSIDPIIIRAENAMMEWLYENYPELRFRISLVQFEQYKNRIANEHPEFSHDLTQLRLTTLREVLEGHVKGDIPGIVKKAYEVFHEQRNRVQYFPYAREIVEDLSREYPLYALSNGNADIHKVGIGHLFQQHYSAGTVGFAKPHPAMFERALQHAGAKPHEGIHIGDHPIQDVQAAQEVGMKTIWVNWFNHPWPLSTPPDGIISNFEDLPDVIERINASRTDR